MYHFQCCWMMIVFVEPKVSEHIWFPRLFSFNGHLSYQTLLALSSAATLQLSSTFFFSWAVSVCSCGLVHHYKRWVTCLIPLRIQDSVPTLQICNIILVPLYEHMHTIVMWLLVVFANDHRDLAMWYLCLVIFCICIFQKSNNRSCMIN